MLSALAVPRAELLRQAVSTAGQERDIAPYAHEGVAPLEIQLRFLLRHGQNPAGSPQSLEAVDRILEGRLHRRMSRFADITKRCCEIARSNEDTIDAFH